jgi:MFS family permease
MIGFASDIEIDRESLPLVFVACFLISAAVNAYAIAPASILPLLIEEFVISKSAAGVAISAAVFGFAVVQLPSGLLMDRYDNRRLVIIGAAVFVPASAAGVFAPSYPLFLLGRFVAGLGAGLLFVLGTNIVGHLFTGVRQGLIVTLYIASAPVGFAVSQFGSPILAARFGWRASFIVYSFVTVIALALFLIAWSTPIRIGEPLTLVEFRQALGNSSVLIVAVSAFCSYMFYIFFNSWMPTYATEFLPMTLAEAGAVTSLLPAVGIVARPVGGWVSDAIGHRRRPVVVASLLFALPGLVVVSQGASPMLFAATMLGVGFSIQFGSGVYYVYARELASPHAAGTSLAVFTTIAFTGTLLSPTVGGWIIDAYSWSIAFGVYGAIGVLGIVLLGLTTDSSPNTVD